MCSSIVIIRFCERINLRQDEGGVTALREYIEARLLLHSIMPDLSSIPPHLTRIVSAASILETTLLVALCSPDVEVCRQITALIGVTIDLCVLVEKQLQFTKAAASILRNGDAYRELASKEFRITGIMAFQKRMRSLLRQMQFPTVAVFNAWEAAFDRWIRFAKDVSITSSDGVDDRLLSQWKNYSGFLAALGGICVSDQAEVNEESAVASLKWIDQQSDNQEESLLTRFFRLSIQLLGCGNVQVRETMRDVLSTEISPILYQRLFRALEAELEILFTAALAPGDKAHDNEFVFAEQSASLLRTLVDRLESPSDLGAAASVHLGSLTLNFARLFDGVSDTAHTLRVKIRICHLCEAVTKRKEHLYLRDDVRIRNQLLERIFGWIARPKSPQPDSRHVSMRLEDSSRVQRDLDKACLKSLAYLTYRLPLQPSDAQTDANMTEMKSQMFHTYFTRFLSLLNQDPVDSSRSDPSCMPGSRDDFTSNSDLAITILSNLLSANIDVGLKHSLNIGYHGNIEIRTAFVKVLYNILVQGTEFNNLTDSAVGEKYEELLELLTKDLSLATSMAIMCPSTEVDELSVCLLTVFEQRGMTFELLEALSLYRKFTIQRMRQRY